MKRTFDQTQLGKSCSLCAKSVVMSVNKPHSQTRTKRTLKPNIQSFYGLPVCTRCLRTMKLVKTAEQTTPATA